MDEIATSPAAKSALEASTDQSLRVPCYCEENVWRLAYRKVYGSNSKNNNVDDDDDGSHEVQYYVVFVTNPEKCVPMFHQLAAKDPQEACFWDYHVILFETTTRTSAASIIPASSSPIDTRNGNDNDRGKTKTSATTTTTTNKKTTLVLDIDSRLRYPCNASEYLNMVFPSEVRWPSQYAPYFRVIEAKQFLQNFSSDRMHMWKRKTKTWSAPPPTYDCIQNSTTTTTKSSNLAQYMNISTQEIINTAAATGAATNGTNSFSEQQQKQHEDKFGRIYSLAELRSHLGLESPNTLS